MSEKKNTRWVLVKIDIEQKKLLTADKLRPRNFNLQYWFHSYAMNEQVLYLIKFFNTIRK